MVEKSSKPPSVFALKMISKEILFRMKQIEHAKSEKHVLSTLSHPFIIKLHAASQDATCLYLLLEYIPGGELFTRIRLWGYFPNDVALFYSAEILLTLQYLHSLRIVYRDLKPENLVIDSEGHIRLIDFGFCKKLAEGQKAHTLCGTPEYLAPEMVKSEGHSFEVDWWAFGILIYEMLCGSPPFVDSNPYNIYKKIVKGEFLFPEGFSAAAEELICELLRGDPAQRLGDVEVCRVQWYVGVDFSQVEAKGVSAPWVPSLVGGFDTSLYATYEDDPEFFFPASASVNQLFNDF